MSSSCDSQAGIAILTSKSIIARSLIRLAKGVPPRECAIEDIHIGGLTPVPFLLAALDALKEPDVVADSACIVSHLALSHKGAAIADAGRAMTCILYAVSSGRGLRDAITEHARNWAQDGQFDTWNRFEDRVVVGRHLTPACYLPNSFTASLYLAWKFHDDFSSGVIANARCGGDNAHRGTVVGALLAAANDIPEHWLRSLRSVKRLRCDTLDPIFHS